MFSAPLLIDILFIPVIISLGIMTSFEDAVSFRIRNRLVFAGIFYSLFIYALCSFLSVSGLLPALPLELRRAVEYLFNDACRWVVTVVVSFIVGYVLWKINLWGGGDAKLFLCYAMLTPIGVYRYIYFNGYFASLLHLQLTFIPATAFIIFRMAFFHLPQLKKISASGCVAAVKKKFSIGGFLKATLGFIAFLLFGMVISRGLSRGVLSFGFGGNITFVIMLLCYKGLTRLFKRSGWIPVIMYALLGTAIMVNPVLLLDVFKQLPKAVLLTLLTGSLAPFLYEMIDAYSEQAKQKYSAMAVWMFIATCLIWI